MSCVPFLLPGLQQTKYPFQEPEKDPANDPKPLTPAGDPDAEKPKVSDVIKPWLGTIPKKELERLIITEALDYIGATNVPTIGPFRNPWYPRAISPITKPLVDLYGDDVSGGPLPRPRPRTRPIFSLPNIQPQLPRSGNEPEIIKFGGDVIRW